jgi:hypothetical protein
MPEFGEVRDFPGATKVVSGVKFKIDGKTYMIIFDTPGFQSSTQAIGECGDQFKIEDIRTFFNGRREFSDDYKALDQVLASHVVLYVIDATCEPTESLQSDFRVLARSGVPVIPLFNFSKDGNSEGPQAWVSFLHHNNYHLDVKYDAHCYRPEHEHDLYEKIRVLLKNPLHRTFFDWHTDWRMAVERSMASNAITEMSDMLLDCATYRHQVAQVETKKQDEVKREASDRFIKFIERRECQGFQGMVAAYKFKPDLLERDTSSVDRKALWQDDLFGKAIERHLGIGVAGGAAAGATLGALVDTTLAWHSLGTASLVGTLAGAVIGAFSGGLYNAKWDRSSHTLSIQCTDNMRRALIERALLLLKALQHRGMADQRDFVVSDKVLRSVKEDFNNLLVELAQDAGKPQLSMIGVDPKTVSKQVGGERRVAIERIHRLIEVLVAKVEDSEDALGTDGRLKAQWATSS